MQKPFGNVPAVTGDTLRAEYARQAADLARKLEVAGPATNFGAGGPDGIRYDGHFYHQIVAMHAARLASSCKSDAELAPMLAMLNAAFARGAEVANA